MTYLLSKSLGYLILLGSLFLKVPQIINVLKNRSVIGLNVYMFVFECAECIPHVIYNLYNVRLEVILGKGVCVNVAVAFDVVVFSQKYPFSTYGENVMILTQDLLLLVLYTV